MIQSTNSHSIHLEKIPSLNGLRAFSIISVILGHLKLNGIIVNNTINFIPLKPFVSFLFDGNIGVNIFFVISGFLITTLLLNEEKKYGSISIKHFFIKRALRIFPAYYFLLFVYFILQQFHQIFIPTTSWMLALTYTKYFNWTLDWFTSHAWSLSVEEQFYLFWPLIFLYAKKIRYPFVVLAFLFVFVFKYILFFQTTPWIDNIHILTRGDGIALGCIVAFKKDQLINLLKKNWHLYGILFITYLVMMRYIFLIHTNNEFINSIIHLFSNTSGTIANICIAVLILYTAYGPKTILYKFLNLKLINFIGLLSYSLYLWQQIFVLKYDNFPLNFPFNIVCLLLVALFSYYVIEKPFLRLKNKLS